MMTAPLVSVIVPTRDRTTELDRALGYEANFAGTSFCTPDQLDSLEYGSNLVNLYADRTAGGASLQPSLPGQMRLARTLLLL